MNTEFSDYLDFYQRGPYAPYLIEQRSAGSSPLRMLKAAQPAGDCSDPATPDLVLQMPINSFSARTDFGAGLWSGRAGGVNSIFFGPPNTPSDIVVDDAFRIFIAAVPFASVESAIRETNPGFTDFGRLHAAPFRDPFVEQICRRLWDEAADGNALGSLFADGAVLALIAALLRLSEQMQALPVAKGGIAPHRLRRVFDCIEAHLGEDISMNDLAAAAELSPLYFARAFRIETGVTPHRHLLERRIERAKKLLSTTNDTVAEIAVACGFCDQSHLSRWFKRLVGTTPSTWQRSDGRLSRHGGK